MRSRLSGSASKRFVGPVEVLFIYVMASGTKETLSRTEITPVKCEASATGSYSEY